MRLVPRLQDFRSRRSLCLVAACIGGLQIGLLLAMSTVFPCMLWKQGPIELPSGPTPPVELSKSRFALYPSLGKTGRMGNQMFELAAALKIAESLSETTAAFVVHETKVAAELQQLLEVIYPDRLLNRVAVFNDPCAPLPPCHDTTNTGSDVYGSGPGPWELQYLNGTLPHGHALCLEGYYQNLENYRTATQQQALAHVFEPRLAHREAVLRQLPILKEPDTIVLHVRRGDYLLAPEIHVNLPFSWYESVLSKLFKAQPWLKRGTILLVSDDLVLMTEEFVPELKRLFPASKVQVAPAVEKQLAAVYSFVMLYLAPTLVMGPSTFSFWAGFLSQFQEWRNYAVMPWPWIWTMSSDFDLCDPPVLPHSFSSKWGVAYLDHAVEKCEKMNLRLQKAFR